MEEPSKAAPPSDLGREQTGDTDRSGRLVGWADGNESTRTRQSDA